MAGSGKSYVGRYLLITADYYDGEDEVEVENGHSFRAKITKYKAETTKREEHWEFIDHEGYQNIILKDTLLRYLIPEHCESDDSDAESGIV